MVAAALISLQEIPNLSSAEFTRIFNFSLREFFANPCSGTPFILAVFLHKNREWVLFSPEERIKEESQWSLQVTTAKRNECNSEKGELQ